MSYKPLSQTVTDGQKNPISSDAVNDHVAAEIAAIPAGASLTLDNLTAPTAVNQDLNLDAGKKLNFAATTPPDSLLNVQGLSNISTGVTFTSNAFNTTLNFSGDISAILKVNDFIYPSGFPNEVRRITAINSATQVVIDMPFRSFGATEAIKVRQTIQVQNPSGVTKFSLGSEGTVNKITLTSGGQGGSYLPLSFDEFPTTGFNVVSSGGQTRWLFRSNNVNTLTLNSGGLGIGTKTSFSDTVAIVRSNLIAGNNFGYEVEGNDSNAYRIGFGYNISGGKTIVARRHKEIGAHKKIIVGPLPNTTSLYGGTLTVSKFADGVLSGAYPPNTTWAGTNVIQLTTDPNSSTSVDNIHYQAGVGDYLKFEKSGFPTLIRKVVSIIHTGSGVFDFTLDDTVSDDYRTSSTITVLYNTVQFHKTNGDEIFVIDYKGDTFIDSAVVINDSGADKDTRIEGDTDENLVFVDASADKVGIGTATPGEKLEVNGNVKANSAILNGATSGNITLSAADTTTPYSVKMPAAQGAASTVLQNDGSGNLSWAASSAGANTALSNLSSVAINTALLGTLGTVSAPAYSFTGDTNTGMWSSAGDILNFSSNGAEALRISQNKTSFQGSTSPTLLATPLATITINNNSGPDIIDLTQGIIFTRNFSGTLTTRAAIASYSTGTGDGGLVFATDNDGVNNTTGLTEKLRLLPNGNFGVGVSNPSVKLHVSGEIKATDRLTFFNGCTITTDQSAGTVDFDKGIKFLGNLGQSRSAIAPIGYTNYNGGLIFGTDSDNVQNTTGITEKMRLSDIGNLGIGTSTPGEKLEVNGNIKATGGDVSIATAGKGLKVAEGSNAKMGTATLSAGTFTVPTTAVTTNSRIFLTVQSLGTVSDPKAIAVTGRTDGQDFTITSADNTDTSVVAWMIVEPA